MAHRIEAEIEISDEDESVYDTAGLLDVVKRFETKMASTGLAQPSNLRAEIERAIKEGQPILLQGLIDGNKEAKKVIADRVDHKRDPLGIPFLVLACKTHGEATVLDLCKTLLHADACIADCDKEGRSALHVAVERDFLRVVEHLLTEGADIDCTDNLGRTPLYLAAAKGSYQMVQFLLNSNANINIVDYNQETCLFAAMRCGSRRLQGLLRDRGVNISIENYMGKTAKEIESESTDKGALTISSSEKNEHFPSQTLLQPTVVDELNLNDEIMQGKYQISTRSPNMDDEDGGRDSENQSQASQEEVIKGKAMNYFSKPDPPIEPARKVARKTLEQQKPAKPVKPRNRKKARGKYSLVRMDVNGVAHVITNGSSLAFKLAYPTVSKQIEDPDSNLPYPLPNPTELYLNQQEIRSEAQKIQLNYKVILLPEVFNSKYHWQTIAESLLKNIKKPMSKTLKEKRLVKTSSSTPKKDSSAISPALVFFSRMFTSANYNLGNQAGIMLSKKDTSSSFQPRLSIRTGLYPNAVRPSQLDKLISKSEGVAKNEGNPYLRDHGERDLELDGLENIGGRKKGVSANLDLKGCPIIDTLLHIPDLVSVFKGPSSLHTIESKLKYNCYASFKDLHDEVLSVFEGWLTYCGIWNDVGVLAYKSIKYWNQLVAHAVEKERGKKEKKATKVQFRQAVANQPYTVARSPLTGRLRSQRFQQGTNVQYDVNNRIAANDNFESSIDPMFKQLIDKPYNPQPAANSYSRYQTSAVPFYQPEPTYHYPGTERQNGYSSTQMVNELDYALPHLRQPDIYAPSRHLAHQGAGYQPSAGSNPNLMSFGFVSSKLHQSQVYSNQTHYSMNENATALGRLAPRTPPPTTHGQQAYTSTSSGQVPTYRPPGMLSPAGALDYKQKTAHTAEQEASEDSFDFAVNNDSD